LTEKAKKREIYYFVKLFIFFNLEQKEGGGVGVFFRPVSPVSREAGPRGQCFG
jgi:hypothetical protein